MEDSLVEKYSNPKKCTCNVDSENFTMISLSQFFTIIPNLSEELKYLLSFLRVLDFRQAVIYVRESIRCEGMAALLEEQGFVTTFIHELMPPKFRLARIERFKEFAGDANILVTSCVGHVMEIQQVDVVIAFDEAESAMLYCHRMSSTKARKGLVINFIRKPTHLAILRQVEKIQKIKISRLPREISTNSYLPPPPESDEEETYVT